jgi:predicted porin
MEFNMKKTLLALLLPSLVATAAGAAEVYKDDGQSINLYGRAYAGHFFSGEEKNAEFGDDSYVRVGAKLKSDITDSMSAFARYELQWDVATGEKQDKTKTRLAYAGVKSDVGSFSYGRQYGALELVADMTDNAYTNAYGNDALGVSKDNQGTNRDNSMLKYSNKFDALQLDGSYVFDDETSKDISTAAYGLAAAYALDFGLTLAAGYNGSSPTDDYDSSLILLGASYKTGPVKVAATFAQGSEFEGKDIDHTGYELTAEYKITKELRAQILYNAQETDNGTTTTDTVDDLVFGARYDFNKHFRTIAEYRINGVDGKDDDFQVAVRYDF